MVTTIAVYLLVASTTLLYQIEATEQPMENINVKTILLSKREIAPRLCCMIQKCEEIPIDTEDHNAFQCYKQEVCGEVCKKENSRRIPLPYKPHTPGYKIKQYIVKQHCQYEQCVNYQFDCARCPNPSKTGFSVYALKNDCIDCYY